MYCMYITCIYLLLFVTDCFNTPGDANDEFNVTLSKIIRELNSHINQNSQKFKSICYYLIHKISVLSQEDKAQVDNSKSVTEIQHVMDPHWNWSSHRLLYIIVEKLKSTKSIEMLQNFNRKINKQMKLKNIHENLQPRMIHSSVYCKMVAILDLQKDYCEVTLEEGLEIEEFVFDYLGGTGAHLSKAYESTPNCAFIEMEWNISTAAVDNLCTEATKHKNKFIEKSFLFLKIGVFIIINNLPHKVSFACSYIVGSYRLDNS